MLVREEPGDAALLLERCLAVGDLRGATEPRTDVRLRVGGFSVREVIAAAERVIGQPIPRISVPGYDFGTVAAD